MNKASKIAPSLPGLIADYLSGVGQLKPFYGERPDLAGLLNAARNRSFPGASREVLTTALKEQAARSKHLGKASQDNINSLADNQVFTITTGHQLCIYGGPMFFIYKILSVIKLCNTLEQAGLKVVPVFWMASEDHDFEEVNHIQIADTTLRWDSGSTGAVGPMVLSGIDHFRRELEALMGKDSMKRESLRWLQSIYSKEKKLADATRDLVYELFGEHGIVVVDGAAPQLKALFKDFIKDELQGTTVRDAVQSATQALGEMAYPAQVTPRDINLFWMDTGVRERIVSMDDGGFATADGSLQWSREEMLQLADRHPEHFSPNVVSRPLYQETILPNIAYVGGPGELSYWLQLKSMFDLKRQSFPVLVLRDMALLLTPKAVKRMGQLGIEEGDLFTDKDELFNALLRKAGTHEHLVEGQIKEITRFLDIMLGDLESLDPGLKKSGEAERKRILNRLEVLQKKVLRFDRQANQNTGRQLQELFDLVFPGGLPQERVFHWLNFVHKEELFDLMTTLLNVFDPLEARLKVLSL